MKEKVTPAEKQIFRYWVELRDLRDGSVRVMPLTCVTKIFLRTRKGDAIQPNQLELRVEDGSHTWIAADVSDLSAQLRTQYPDGVFERTLKSERDLAAEEKRETALRGLIEILARAAVDELLEEGGAQGK